MLLNHGLILATTADEAVCKVHGYDLKDIRKQLAKITRHNVIVIEDAAGNPIGHAKNFSEEDGTCEAALFVTVRLRPDFIAEDKRITKLIRFTLVPTDKYTGNGLH